LRLQLQLIEFAVKSNSLKSRSLYTPRIDTQIFSAIDKVFAYTTFFACRDISTGERQRQQNVI